MSSKILNIYENTPIKSIQYFVPSIVYENAKDWFYSNYIQLEWEKNDCIHFTILEKNKVGISPISIQLLNKEFIEAFNINPIDLVHYYINNEYYIQLCLNERYIPNRGSFEKEDYIHDNMVYGYSDEDILLYGYGANGHLGKSKVSTLNFTKSINWESSRIKLGVGSFNYARQVLLMKLENNTYNLDIIAIINQLKEYAEGRDSQEAFRNFIQYQQDKIYGIKVYDRFVDEIADENAKVINDLRNIYIILDHKKMMQERVRYLRPLIGETQFNWLENEIEEIKVQVRRTCNLCMKYKISRGKKDKERLMRSISIIKEKEIVYVNKLINALL